MNEQEIFDYETGLDALLNYMKMLPKPTLKLLNFERYQEMMQSAYNLQQLISETISNGSLTVEINQDFNLGAISVELSDLCVLHPLKFADIVSKADNFEVYPLINGNLRLDVTFQNVLKSYYSDEQNTKAKKTKKQSNPIRVKKVSQTGITKQTSAEKGKGVIKIWN